MIRNSKLIASLVPVVLTLSPGALVPAKAGEKQNLASIIERLKPAGVLRTDFVQTKHVAALSRPLQSEGKLTFSRTNGIIWQIRKPFPFTYALTEQSVIQFEEGKKPVVVAVAQQPVVHEFIELFLALFSGEAGVLESRFEISYTPGETSWQLGLVPKNQSIRQYIASLQITGGKYIREIIIREKGGDFTKILLSNPAHDTQLTSHEKRFFNKP